MLLIIMQSFNAPTYGLITTDFDEIQIADHMNGFSKNYTNSILDKIKDYNIIIWTQYIVNNQIRENYPNLTFKFSTNIPTAPPYDSIQTLAELNTQKSFKNFVCSFNGTNHVSRQFLISALYKNSWFDKQYNSKNFIMLTDEIDGNISSFFENNEQERFYRKFIIDESLAAAEFYKSIINFNYVSNDHTSHNMYHLIDKLNSSFMCIVSETMGTSYYPWVSEKVWQPIMSKSLWAAYAQPGYHAYLSTHFGFKLYTKIFDYKFDIIENPVIRLVELITMLSKFKKLSLLDWHDLYLIEQDTIEFNHYHFFSNGHVTKLGNYES